MISDEKLFMIAVAYYANGRRQQDIAEELGVSHVQIGKYLKLARQRGIVEISINPPYVDSDDAKKYCTLMKSVFGLENLVLVPTASSFEQTHAFLVRGAAKHILENWPNRPLNVGIGMGRTMAGIARTKISYADKRPGWKIYPVPNYYGRHLSKGREEYFSYDGMADDFCRNWGGKADRSFMDDVASGNASAEAAGKYWSRLNLLIGGVGVPFPLNPSARVSMFGEQTAAAIGGKDICGDYLNYHLDSDGNRIEPVFHNPGHMSWDQICAVPHRIAVASGLHKVPGIVSLLKSRTVNTLVTDIETAKRALEYSL